MCGQVYSEVGLKELEMFQIKNFTCSMAPETLFHLKQEVSLRQIL